MLSEIQLTMMLNGYSPMLLSIAYYVSQSLYVMLAAAIILAARRKGIKSGFYALVVISFIYAINFALKSFFNSPRPDDNNLNIIFKESDPRFPSGHASTSFGAAAMSESRLFYIWAILISLSRLVLGVHYISDIIAGAVLGYAIGKLASKYERLIYEKVFSKELIFETRRQLVHGSLGVAVSVFAYLVPDLIAKTALFLSVIVLLLASYAIKRGIYMPLIGEILDAFERKKDMQTFPLKGTIFFMSGAFISLMLYEKTIASASIIILALGDSFSTLAGKPFGKTKHPHNPEKSVEGSTAGFVAAFMGAAFLVPPKLAIIGAFSGMLIESFDLKVFGKTIDDNFLIPIICGAAMSAVLTI